ncbi:MAG: sigma-70 family RNA polymerase sigma factor [Myxococcota bacterium]
MDEPTDLDLLNRWRTGESKAGELLFDRYYDEIHRFFASKVKEDVADLVQTTFVGCIEAKERFDGRNGSPFKAYLFGIARYKMFEFFRSRRREAHLSALDSTSMSIEEIGGSLTTWLHDKNNHHLLRRALPRIPLESQLLLELYLWENFTAQQLAVVMEIPEDTVRSRFRRAKQLLCRQVTRAASTPAEGTETLDSISTWCLDMQDRRDREYPELRWAR